MRGTSVMTKLTHQPKGTHFKNTIKSLTEITFLSKHVKSNH